jgi:molybdopterin-guanine dinucleotide biosynthesis protein A
MAKRSKAATAAVETCILAGGQSRRMGRDKSRVRLGRRTLLGHTRAVARGLGLPVRVIRKDLVARCGPLGGVLTALKTSRARAVLFLACDMPFVSPELMCRLLQDFARHQRPVCVAAGDEPGFPLLLRCDDLSVVETQLAAGQRALWSLAACLKARRLRLPRGAPELLNVNSPPDLERARASVGLRRRRAPAQGFRARSGSAGSQRGSRVVGARGKGALRGPVR